MKKTDAPVIVEQTFYKSIQKVWKAITELDQMQQWFFEEITAFEPKVGFETQFPVQVEDRQFIHLWRLTEVIPLKKITYNWKYKGYQGDSFVSFKLFTIENQTKLVLTHTVVENFQKSIPEFSRDNCVGGWTYFIKERLKDYLKTIEKCL